MATGNFTKGDMFVALDDHTIMRIPAGDVGDLWSANGAGQLPSWEPAPSSGADTALSNLASVAIDVELTPAVDLTYTLGSGSKHWQTTFTREVKGGATLYLYAQTTDDTLLFLGATGSGFLQAGGDFTLWYGSALYFDADRTVGATGATGFDKTAKTGSGGMFNCKYEGTVVWRLESATLLFLNDGVTLKTGVSTGLTIAGTSAQKIGFHGAAPTAQSTGWSIANPSSRKSLDVASATLAELREFVGTLAQAIGLDKGLIGA